MTVDDVRILRDIGMSFCFHWLPSSLTLPQNNFTAHKLYVAPSAIASYCFHCWWFNPQGRNAGKCCGAYLGLTRQTAVKLLLALSTDDIRWSAYLYFMRFYFLHLSLVVVVFLLVDWLVSRKFVWSSLKDRIVFDSLYACLTPSAVAANAQK